MPMRALALALSLAAAAASAQPLTPALGPFDAATLPTARVELDPDTLAWILDPANAESDREWRATFTWTDAAGAESVDEIGFRLRGNTSRRAEKKSFKVSFNTYRPGREWRGLDKLNLNGEHNDPTVLRAIVAWGIARDARIPASRANPVRLVINGSDFGVYANVEHLDDEFLTRHFRDSGGVLYKCLYPADLDDLGTDPAAYRELAPFGRPVYDLQEGDGDHSDLAAFVVALNRTPLADLPDAVEQHLDVNGYLRALAFDILTGNWDGYAYNQNNFYLYQDPEIGVFRYLPYDLDNTLGIDFIGRDWGTRGVYDWPRGATTGAPPRPLAKRLLQVSDYVDRLSFYLGRLLDGPFAADRVEPRVAALRALIRDAVAADPYYPLDYGWGLADFDAAFEQRLGGHVDYGLLPFVETRRATARAELRTRDVPPLISELRLAPREPVAGQALTVRAWVEDEAPPAAVRLRWRADGGAWATAPMREDGGGVWSARFGPFEAGAAVEYAVEAEDEAGQLRSAPRRGIGAPARVDIGGTPGGTLFVNEVLASNDAVLPDEAGEFDDWIELYNGGAEAVSLAGHFLTDDLAEPAKFALPDTLIPAGGHLLVWADNDPEQGPLHATFRLSAGGEDAALFGPDGAGGLALVDGFSFGEQTADVSFGRATDGAAELVAFAAPTPGAANGGPTGADGAPAAPRFAVSTLAPNPNAGLFALTLALPTAATVEGEVVDALGRVVGRIEAEAHPAGEARILWRDVLAPGAYVAVLRATGAGRTELATRRFTVVR